MCLHVCVCVCVYNYTITGDHLHDLQNVKILFVGLFWVSLLIDIGLFCQSLWMEIIYLTSTSRDPLCRSLSVFLICRCLLLVSVDLHVGLFWSFFFVGACCKSLLIYM